MLFGYILSGLLVGLLLGVTGVGAGALMTPMLLFVFGFKPTVAVGTDLIFGAITKTGGILVHHSKHRSVQWKIMGLLCLGSLPAALATITTLRRIGGIDNGSSRLITVLLGIALILTGISLLVRSYLGRNAAPITAEEPEIVLRVPRMLATVGLGAVIGVLVTLTSVGAGALGTVALMLLFPRLATVKVVGTDLAYAIPLYITAGAGHVHLGNVNYSALFPLLLGSLPGIWMGSHFSGKIPCRSLRMGLSVLLVLIGIKLLGYHSA
jgi:uncharacterized membrane protein YfcA